VKHLFEKQNNFEPKEENKMKKLTGILMISLLALGLVGVGLAGTSDTHNLTITIPPIAEISVVDAAGNNNQSITLQISNSVTAGAAYWSNSESDTANSTLYLRYTVLTSAAKKITAQITTGTVPTALDLTVQATIGSAGGGNQGTSAGEVTLDGGAAQDVITSIGSCWTGISNGAGANLTYKLKMEAGHTKDELTPTTANLVITYTITS